MLFRSATCANTSFRTSTTKLEKPVMLSCGHFHQNSELRFAAVDSHPDQFPERSLVASRISLVEMAGGMDVHKNKYIEDWGTARENLEKTFRFNRRNITLAIIFGIALPLLTYQGVTGEFHKQDVAAEQPRRKFLGSQ